MSIALLRSIAVAQRFLGLGALLWSIATNSMWWSLPCVSVLLGLGLRAVVLLDGKCQRPDASLLFIVVIHVVDTLIAFLMAVLLLGNLSLFATLFSLFLLGNIFLVPASILGTRRLLRSEKQ